MKKATLHRIISVLCALTLLFSVWGSTFAASSYDEDTQEETVITDYSQPIQDFVKRMYRITFGRDPDAAGFDHWCSLLTNRQITAGGVAYQFVFSQEFKNKMRDENMTLEQYIRYHYLLLMDREPDSVGLPFWIDYMGTDWNTDTKKTQLFTGFVNSDEFSNICRDFGIFQGYYDGGHTPDQNTNVAKFVERLYNIVLGRESENAGLFHWSKILLNGSMDGAAVGYEFVFSQEFKNLNLSNEQFVTCLYRAFLDREPDADGLKHWMDLLSAGAPRDAIFGGFVHSQEFTNICSAFGIVRGTKEVSSMELAQSIVAINELRAKNGAGPLVVDDLMQQWADIRAQELSVKFSHYRPDGSSCFQVAKNLGIPYTAAAENIACKVSTADGAMQLWLNSDGHRKNIMNPDYNHVALAKFVDANGTYYWAMVFARY